MDLLKKLMVRTLVTHYKFNYTYTDQARSQGYQTIDTDVQVGMVAIGEKLNSYSEITSLTTNSMQINENVTGTGSTDVYIYQSRGLKDNSIQNFCR